MKAAKFTTLAAAAETSAWSVFQRAGFFDYQSSAAVLTVVERGYSGFRFGIVFKFNETKTSAATGHLIGDDGGRSRRLGRPADDPGA